MRQGECLPSLWKHTESGKLGSESRDVTEGGGNSVLGFRSQGWISGDVGRDLGEAVEEGGGRVGGLGHYGRGGR